MVQIVRVTEEESDVIEKVRNELYDFNRTQVMSATYEALNFIVLAETGELLAGLLSHRFGESVFLDILWVKEGIRSQGIGSRLLSEFERTARGLGVKVIHLDTHDFQAPGFYLKHGYVIFGVLENVPLQGINRFFMKKKFEGRDN